MFHQFTIQISGSLEICLGELPFRQVTEVGTPNTPMSDQSPTTLMPAPRLLVPGADGEGGWSLDTGIGMED